MTHRRRVVVLWAACAIFACRLALALTLIPPWQQPDEQAHVAIAEVWRNRILASGAPDAAREAEILQSMGRYKWWQYYGVETPPSLPSRFANIGKRTITTIGIDPYSPDHPRLYYATIGAMLSLMGPTPVVRDMYAMRVVSSVLALLTLWVAWRGVCAAVGESAGVAVTVMLALHPEFIVVSTASGPDAWVNFLGACVWWMAVLLVMNSGHFSAAMVGLWGAAFLGAVSDRMGLPLLAAAFVVSIVALGRRLGVTGRTVVAGAIAAVMFGVSWWFPEAARRIFHFVVSTPLIPVPEAQSWDWASNFNYVLFESWWSTLGWSRYVLPDWWIGVAVVLSTVAASGLLRRLIYEHDSETRLVAGLAMTLLAIQIGAVYWAFLRQGVGARGRYLFPWVVPALLLMWMGIEAWLPIAYRRHAVVGFATILAVLDTAVWLRVAIPVYTG